VPSYHHGNLREAALEAAAELIETQGEAKVSLRTIAEQVGVTHRALYRHFPDRAALLAEVACGALETLHAEMQAVIRHADPEPETRMVAVIESYIDFALKRPATYRHAFTAGFAKRSAHPGLAKVARALGRSFGALVEALPPPDARQPRPKEDAIALWALLHGMIDLYWGGSLRASSPTAARRYMVAQVSRQLGLQTA